MSSHPEYLGWLIKRVQHSHHRALDKRLARLGTGLVQWNALREIERNPGCSQHQLAEKTFNSDQAFGTLINRLQLAGLIERQPGPGRAFTHVLTREGRKLLEEGQAVMTEVTKHSFISLNEEERQQLARILDKILTRS